MFAPIGYTPVAKLWDGYVANNFRLVYDHATRHYHSDDFQAWNSRGSPVDIFEHLFLNALTNLGIHLASPKGEIVKFHVRYFDHYPCLFQKVFPMHAAWQIAALELDLEPSYEPKRVEGFYFLAWEADDDDKSAFRKKYPRITPDRKFDSFVRPYGHCSFHSLPIFYERENFRVVSDVSACGSK